jgi:TolB-like protein/DNA-binding winged helix-turn-helix (wHTH) protein/Tfp pilus assembly protein PilF
MLNPLASSDIARFGPFQVDFRAGELFKNGRKIRLQGQPLQVLALLIEKPDAVITREQLRQKLWPHDTFVDFDHGLNNAINRLREALNDSAEKPRFIQTLPRRGYRFVAKVHVAGNGATQSGPPGSSLEAKSTDYEVQSASAPAAEARPALPLRRTFAFAAAGLCVAAALAFGLYLGRGTSTAPRIHSIAVLPLVNLSSDPAQEYFADGMTDELITDLASIASLRVISRTSAAHYKGTRKTLPEIARELGVDAVVEGSVSRSTNKVRIRAQLIRAAPEEHLWAESYERDLADVLVLQREVATAIAAKIKINLTPQEKARLATARPINPDAYNAYLLGMFHSEKRNPASIAKGIGYFQKAIRIDPGYAQAYVGLANAYFEEDIWGSRAIGSSAEQIRVNTLKALELDANLAEAHVLMGLIHYLYDWDWPGTEQEYRRAIELNPNYAFTFNRYAYFLQTVGRQQEALAAAHHAVELDPLSVANLCDEGRILYRARQYQNAISRYQRALELDPGYLPALSRMLDANELLGNHAEALAYLDKWQKTLGPDIQRRAPIAWIYARTGKRREAAQIVQAIVKDGTPADDPGLVYVYAALGDRDRAFASLQRGVQERSMLPILLADPALDSLRADPRFEQLLGRVGLSR